MSLKERIQSYLSGYYKGYDNTGAIRWLHRNEPELWQDILAETEWLGEASLPKQRCWHILNDVWERPVCPYSGELVDWQGSRYRAFNGKGANNRDPEEQKKRKAFYLQKFGVDNPAKVPAYRAKQEATNLAKYGHTNFLASQQGVELVKQAWADPEHKAKRLQSIHDTFQEKFGGFPYQNPEIFKKAMKNGMKYRPYTMPSGKVIQVQGYEDIALDELLRGGVDEANLITDKGEVPVIWYEFEGKNRRYYPDIFIPSQNKLIEVKSSFSYQYEEAKNQAKKKACETAGFLFELKIYASRPKPLN